MTTISLADIRAAGDDYIENQVTTTLGTLVPAVPQAWSPGELATTSVTVRNATEANGGVPVVDIRHHLTANPLGRVQWQVPVSPPARATADSGDPLLVVGSFHDEIFLFPTDSTLDVGDVDVVSNLKVKAITLGAVSVLAHIHGSPDQSYLFGRRGGDNGSQAATIV